MVKTSPCTSNLSDSKTRETPLEKLLSGDRRKRGERAALWLRLGAAKTAAGRDLAGFSPHPFPASFRPIARRLRGKESSSSSLHSFPYCLRRSSTRMLASQSQG